MSEHKAPVGKEKMRRIGIMFHQLVSKVKAIGPGHRDEVFQAPGEDLCELFGSTCRDVVTKAEVGLGNVPNTDFATAVPDVPIPAGPIGESSEGEDLTVEVSRLRQLYRIQQLALADQGVESLRKVVEGMVKYSAHQLTMYSELAEKYQASQAELESCRDKVNGLAFRVLELQPADKVPNDKPRTRSIETVLCYPVLRNHRPIHDPSWSTLVSMFKAVKGRCLEVTQTVDPNIFQANSSFPAVASEVVRPWLKSELRDRVLPSDAAGQNVMVHVLSIKDPENKLSKTEWLVIRILLEEYISLVNSVIADDSLVEVRPEYQFLLTYHGVDPDLLGKRFSRAYRRRATPDDNGEGRLLTITVRDRNRYFTTKEWSELRLRFRNLDSGISEMVQEAIVKEERPNRGVSFHYNHRD